MVCLRAIGKAKVLDVITFAYKREAGGNTISEEEIRKCARRGRGQKSKRCVQES